MTPQVLYRHMAVIPCCFSFRNTPAKLGENQRYHSKCVLQWRHPLVSDQQPDAESTQVLQKAALLLPCSLTQLFRCCSRLPEPWLRSDDARLQAKNWACQMFIVSKAQAWHVANLALKFRAPLRLGGTTKLLTRCSLKHYQSHAAGLANCTGGSHVTGKTRHSLVLR